MSTVKFAEVHNLVAFLSKPTESKGFEQIVDFLNANPIRYALNVNPTVYILCIEQFWTTAEARIINEEAQIHAKVDEKKVIISKESIKRDLQFRDVKGIDGLPNTTIFEQLGLIGTVASAIICLATNQKFNFSKWIFKSMGRNLDNESRKLLMYPRKAKRKDTQVPQLSGPTESVIDEAVHKELGDSLVRVATTASSLKAEQDYELCTTLQSRVLDLEKTKTAQALEIDSLKKRVKKLKKKQRSRTYKLKRLYKVGLSARFESSNDNEDLGKDASKQESISDINSDEDITLVSTHDDVEMFDDDKYLLGEVVFVAKQDENVIEKEIDVTQDKGKAIMIKEPVKLKKKDQLMLDEEVALKLHAKLQAEFNKEERLASEKAQQEEEEEKRRKLFTAKAAEEKRNKPPTQAQQIKIMCTYLKNMEGKKLKDLKNKSFDSIQKMFDKYFKRVNTLEPISSKLVEESSKKAKVEVMKGSSKRARTELEQEIFKKQKIDDDKETAKLKQLVKIIPDEEGVAIHTISLAVKPLSVVDCKIHKEGKKRFYKIIRADGSSKICLFSFICSKVLTEKMWKLYGNCEFKTWRMRIEQYIQMINYALWDVIENGPTLPKIKVMEGVTTLMPITSIEDKAQRRLEVKARKVKGMSSSNSRTQNMDFVSSSNNNSTNGAVNIAQAVNTALGLFTACTQVNTANINNLSDVVICAFLASQPSSPQLVNEDLE
nr:hypothetical protein [Tanacetum cinerariifolium]GEY69374.1 hypothetical protein [Tanacetum cinerariifolium]